MLSGSIETNASHVLNRTALPRDGPWTRLPARGPLRSATTCCQKLRSRMGSRNRKSSNDPKVQRRYTFRQRTSSRITVAATAAIRGPTPKSAQPERVAYCHSRVGHLAPESPTCSSHCVHALNKTYRISKTFAEQASSANCRPC